RLQKSLVSRRRGRSFSYRWEICATVKAVDIRFRKCECVVCERSLDGLNPRLDRILIKQHKARDPSQDKRHTTPDHYPPGPWNLTAEPQIEFDGKAKHHPDHCSSLIGASREHAKQKYSQQCAISYRRNLQSHFDHAPTFMKRDYSQSKQCQCPENRDSL